MIIDKPHAADGLDAVLAAINNTGGPAPGSLVLYTGSAPANCAAAPTGTQLANCTIGTGSADAFAPTDTTTLTATGNTSGGVWAQDSSPANSGTAGYWRIVDYGGNCRAQGSVSLTGGGGELILSSLAIVAGVPVTITSFTVTITGVT